MARVALFGLACKQRQPFPIGVWRNEVILPGTPPRVGLRVPIVIEHDAVQQFVPFASAIYFPVKLTDGLNFAGIRHNFVGGHLRHCVIQFLRVVSGSDRSEQHKPWNVAANDLAGSFLENHFFMNLVVAIEIADPDRLNPDSYDVLGRAADALSIEELTRFDVSYLRVPRILPIRSVRNASRQRQENRDEVLTKTRHNEDRSYSAAAAELRFERRPPLVLLCDGSPRYRDLFRATETVRAAILAAEANCSGVACRSALSNSLSMAML